MSDMTLMMRIGAMVDNSFNRAFANTQEQMSRLNSWQDGFRNTLMTGTAQFAAFSAPLVAGAKSAIEFETAMAEVNKTVGFDSQAKLSAFGDEIKALSTRIPMSVNELASIAASGGQLGVAQKDLVQFTETVSQMSVAFDMSAEQAGTSMSQMVNAMGEPISAMGAFGDAINAVSNSSPARADQIIDALGRVGQVGKNFGLVKEETIALSSAFIAMGAAPEVAATSVKGMLTTLSILDPKNKKQGAAFKQMGLDMQEFSQMVKTDGQEAIFTLLNGINQLPQNERTGVLTGIFGREYAGQIATLAGGIDTYRGQLETLIAVDANGKPQYIGSMAKEFATISGTTANKMQLFKNNIALLAMNIGDALIPSINQAILTMTPLIQSFSTWANKNPELIVSITKIVGGLLLAKVAFAGVGFATISFIRPMIKAVGVLRDLRSAILIFRGLSAMGEVTSRARTFATAIQFIGRAFGALRVVMMTNPIGLVVTLLISAAVLIRTYWKPIKAFFAGFFTGIMDGLIPVKGMLSSIVAPMRQAFAPLKPIIEPLIGTLSMFGSKVKLSADSMLKVKSAGMAFGYAIGTILKYLIIAIPAFVSAMVMGFRTVGTAIGTLAGAIVVKGGQVINWFRLLPSKISSVFVGLPARFRQYGINIIQGLIGGVTAKFGALKAKMSEMANTVSGFFANKLGIRSPSRVFMGFGHNIAEGVAIGITQQTPMTIKASDAMAKRLAQTEYSNKVLGSQSLSSGMRAGTVHFSPNINVQVGAGANDAAGQVQQGLAASYAEFERMLERVEANRQRRAYA